MNQSGGSKNKNTTESDLIVHNRESILISNLKNYV